MRSDLSPEDRVVCAYSVLVDNVEQQKVATLMRVNLGRVNEAQMNIGFMAGMYTEPSYKVKKALVAMMGKKAAAEVIETMVKAIGGSDV